MEKAFIFSAHTASNALKPLSSNQNVSIDILYEHIFGEIEHCCIDDSINHCIALNTDSNSKDETVIIIYLRRTFEHSFEQFKKECI